MPGYAYNIHNVKLTRSDTLRVSGNVAIFAILYSAAGAFLSYILWYAFDPYDPYDVHDPEQKQIKAWNAKGLGFQLYDLLVEIVIIAMSIFWLTYYLDRSTPLIPVRKGLEDFIDSYTSGVFFLFAVFIFLDDLTYKMKYVFKTIFGSFFDYWVPEEGSILDFSVRYSERQMKMYDQGQRKKQGASFVNA